MNQRALTWALWSLCACGTPVADTVPVEVAPVEVAVQTMAGEVTPDELPDMSLYLADLPIVDQADQTDMFDRYAGHPVITTMFYATCTHTCPILLQKILAFEDSLPAEIREEVRVLVVSFEQDDAATLLDVAERHGIDTTRWTLARTDPGRVRELAALLDVTYRRNPEGGFNHTSGFTVLDSTGVIRAQIEDMNAPTAPLLEALKVISAGSPAVPPID
jgi:protein SCO1/2